MRKKLLSFVLPILFFGTIVNAQTKIWDFANDTSTWPLSDGYAAQSGPVVVDDLGLYPAGGAGNSNFGLVNANSFTFSDGFTTVNRFQPNGGGSAGGTFLPSQRYLFFSVSGACTVKIWARTGGGGTRNVLITDGTNLIATGGGSTSGEEIILTANVSAANASAGFIYIYSDQACNYYKLEVTGATVNPPLSLDNLNKSTTNVFGAGNQVYVQNVTSNTEVRVYGITGALVKSFNTTSDVNFELNKGLYIVNVKSEEGEKAVKVLMN